MSRVGGFRGAAVTAGFREQLTFNRDLEEGYSVQEKVVQVEEQVFQVEKSFQVEETSWASKTSG